MIDSDMQASNLAMPVQLVKELAHTSKQSDCAYHLTLSCVVLQQVSFPREQVKLWWQLVHILGSSLFVTELSAAAETTEQMHCSSLHAV